MLIVWLLSWRVKTSLVLPMKARPQQIPLTLLRAARPQHLCHRVLVVMMTNMTDAVNNVANAMLKTCAAHIDPDLYLAVMETPDFSTEALIVAYTHLLENKVVATGFVNMTTPHRAIWLQTYLAKNYYM